MNKLKSMYPSGGSIIIRKLVRLHIQKVEAKMADTLTEKELQDD